MTMSKKWQAVIAVSTIVSQVAMLALYYVNEKKRTRMLEEYGF